MSDSLVNVTVEPKELIITLIDSSSTTVELNPNPVEVTINSAVQNTVTVTLGGGRGAVWLPDGSTYDGASLAAILAGHISKTQLANDLAEEIELTSTGLIEAQADLQGAINTLLATGDTLDDTISRMEIVEDTIVLQSSRLNSVESNITTARVDIDNNIIRLTAAETSLTDNSNYITTQQSILSNEWTVKIFENTDGSMCSAGIGLLVYPAWKVNSVYEIDDYCWFDDSVYKSKIVHTSNASITPANSSYWELIPYGTKSQFGVLADTFFVQTQKDGNTYTPFVIYEDQVVVNGDMVINGLIKANYILANNIATWSLQSHNYESGISGYKLDATTGLAEFNNITLEVNANIMGPNLVPNSNFRNTTTHDWIVYINPTNDNTATISYNPIDSYNTKWRLAFSNVLGLTRIVGSSSFYSYFEIIKNTPIYITPNTKYCYFAYLMSFRCTARVDLIIYDSSNNILQRINGEALSPDNSNLNNALSLNDWTQSGKIFTTPNETSYCKFVVWSSENTTVTYNAWTQIAYLYLSTLNDTTNTLPSWVIDTVDEYTATTHRALNDTLDTETGGIIVKDGGNRRYAHLTGGDLTFYDYVGSEWVPYKSVTKTVTGTCVDGETVNIGYFREQPKVQISPYLLDSYIAEYYLQSQKFFLQATNLRKSGSDWFFNVVAKLILASSSGTISLQSAVNVNAINYAGGGYVGNAYSWDSYTNSVVLPSNVVSVSLSFSLTRVFAFVSGITNIVGFINATVSIEAYVNGSWITGGSVYYAADTNFYILYGYIDKLPHTDTGTLSVSSANTISMVRIKVSFIKNSSVNGITGTSNNTTQILQITGGSYNITSSQISASGTASYMAIG